MIGPIIFSAHQSESGNHDMSDEEPDVSTYLTLSDLASLNGLLNDVQDPIKETEAEMILDCYEKFNEVIVVIATSC